MAQPGYPSPLDEQTLLQLQGGLKGRFSRSFSVLQGAVDTLERYLERRVSGDMLDDIEPLFADIHAQVRELQHLSDNAVGLLTGTVLHDPGLLRPTDIAAYLRVFCASANDELADLGAKARVVPDLPEGQVYCLPASEALLNALLMNLVSNSVHARHDTTVTVALRADGTLRYTDTGPGPGPDAAGLLRGDTVNAKILRQGGLGLMIAVACAQDLGWELTLDEDAPGGFALAVQLPQPIAAGAAVLCSDAAAESLRARLRRQLRRELALALG